MSYVCCQTVRRNLELNLTKTTRRRNSVRLIEGNRITSELRDATASDLKDEWVRLASRLSGFNAAGSDCYRLEYSIRATVRGLLDTVERELDARNIAMSREGFLI